MPKRFLRVVAIFLIASLQVEPAQFIVLAHNNGPVLCRLPRFNMEAIPAEPPFSGRLELYDESIKSGVDRVVSPQSRRAPLPILDNLAPFHAILNALINHYGPVENMRGWSAMELGATDNTLQLLEYLRDQGLEMQGIGDEITNSAARPYLHHVLNYEDYFAAHPSQKFRFIYTRFGLVPAAPVSLSDEIAPLNRQDIIGIVYAPIVKSLNDEGLLIVQNYAGEDELSDDELRSLGLQKKNQYKFKVEKRGALVCLTLYEKSHSPGRLIAGDWLDRRVVDIRPVWQAVQSILIMTTDLDVRDDVQSSHLTSPSAVLADEGHAISLTYDDTTSLGEMIRIISAYLRPLQPEWADNFEFNLAQFFKHSSELMAFAATETGLPLEQRVLSFFSRGLTGQKILSHFHRVRYAQMVYDAFGNSNIFPAEQSLLMHSMGMNLGRLAMHRSFRSLVAQTIGMSHHGARALSIGSGPAELERELKETWGLSMTVLDVSRVMIDRMKEVGFAPVMADGEKLPFGNDRFDIVIFPFSIGNMHLETAITEAYRVLNPGGILHLLNPSVGSWIFYRAYSANRIEEALTAIGFKDIRHRDDVVQIVEMAGRQPDIYITATKSLSSDPEHSRPEIPDLLTRALNPVETAAPAQSNDWEHHLGAEEFSEKPKNEKDAWFNDVVKRVEAMANPKRGIDLTPMIQVIRQVLDDADAYFYIEFWLLRDINAKNLYAKLMAMELDFAVSQKVISRFLDQLERLLKDSAATIIASDFFRDPLRTLLVVMTAFTDRGFGETTLFNDLRERVQRIEVYWHQRREGFGPIGSENRSA